MKITKDILRKLNAEVGNLDLDSNQVFEGFVGRLFMADMLYHGELTFSDPGEEPPDITISISSIVSPEATEQPITEEGEDDGESYADAES